MKILNIITKTIGGIFVLVILLDLPEMGELLTSLRLLLLIAAIVIIRGLGKFCLQLFGTDE